MSERPATGTPEYGQWLAQPGNLNKVLGELRERGCVPSMSVAEFREFKYGPETRNIRISILDLIIAARALHEFRLVAAGHVWATIELSETQCQKLTAARVHWQPD